jgi:CRP/FNR family transcriptional regulator, cyclic AMP receptor protein
LKDIVQEILNDPTFMEGIGWKKRYFQANEIIFRGGEPSKSLFFIEAGTLRVTVQVELENSKNMHTGICDMEAGEIFGETCFQESGMRNASVAAITYGYVVEIDAEKLSAYLDANPVKGHLFFKKLLLTIFERLKQDNRRIESLLAWGFKANDLIKYL